MQFFHSVYDDYLDGGYQPVLPKVWQNRALTAIPIVISNMLKLPSKRYLKSEKLASACTIKTKSQRATPLNT